METRISPNTTTNYSTHTAVNSSPATGAVSWGAIFAGAAASAAISLIILLLGSGLGLASVSPWSNSGISGTTFGVSTIVWITLTSIIASGLGGYIAGRLRTRWLNTHVDEIHFRDTAHGFLVWGVATLVTARLLTSVISSIVSTGAQAGATIVGGAAAATATTAAVAANGAASKTDSDNSLTYFVDSLFRKDATSGADAAASKTEVGRIFVNGISTGSLSPADTKYVGQVVAQTTGLNQQDAEKRVTDTFNTVQKKLRDAETAAREAADKTRKASAYGSLWLFISLLIGAFTASLLATYGGRQRDLQ